MNVHTVAVLFVIGCTPSSVFSSDVAGRHHQALQSKKNSVGGSSDNYSLSTAIDRCIKGFTGTYTYAADCYGVAFMASLGCDAKTRICDYSESQFAEEPSDCVLSGSFHATEHVDPTTCEVKLFKLSGENCNVQESAWGVRINRNEFNEIDIYYERMDNAPRVLLSSPKDDLNTRRLEQNFVGVLYSKSVDDHHRYLASGDITTGDKMKVLDVHRRRLQCPGDDGDADKSTCTLIKDKADCLKATDNDDTPCRCLLFPGWQDDCHCIPDTDGTDCRRMKNQADCWGRKNCKWKVTYEYSQALEQNVYNNYCEAEGKSEPTPVVRPPTDPPVDECEDGLLCCQAVNWPSCLGCNYGMTGDDFCKMGRASDSPHFLEKIEPNCRDSGPDPNICKDDPLFRFRNKNGQTNKTCAMIISKQCNREQGGTKIPVHKYCSMTCGKCGTEEEDDDNDGPCEDKEEQCEEWAGFRKNCENGARNNCKTFSKYMHVNCPRSCKVCPDDDPSDPPSDSPSDFFCNDMKTEADCIDKNEDGKQCEWYILGFSDDQPYICEAGSRWCCQSTTSLSCLACRGEMTVEDYCKRMRGFWPNNQLWFETISPQCDKIIGPACLDKKEQCKEWAGRDTNECERNSKYMHSNCPRSCKVCPVLSCDDMKTEADCIDSIEDGRQCSWEQFFWSDCPGYCW